MPAKLFRSTTHAQASGSQSSASGTISVPRSVPRSGGDVWMAKVYAEAMVLLVTQAVAL
jgi:hypothetical protein